MKLLPKILLGGVAVLVLIQLVRPDHTNPPVTGPIHTPPEVLTLLKRSCFDCHSNETTWPWYSQIAPVSWLVARDVNEGRKHLNFSQWEGYEPGRKAKKLEEVASEVTEGGMPMEIYLPMHPDAKLSEGDRKVLVDWAKAGNAPTPAPEAPAPATP
jgi:hypothetical protein